MTEAQYRALDIDSYSSIKTFIEDRKKYYKKFVLKEPIRDPDSPSKIFGSLVDCLMFTPDEFDSRFAMAITDVPKGQYGKLVDELMSVTIRSVNDDNEVTRDIEDMLEEAYKNVKYDRNGSIVDFKRDSFQVVKDKFLGSNLEMYYRQLRESHGKNVIEPSMVENAIRIIGELRSNPITSSIIAPQGDEIEVRDQMPIVGNLNSLGLDFEAKCLPDRILINHEKKIIYPIDLKTAWDNETEFVSNYFKYKYYIQAALYYYLIVEWAATQENLRQYAVEHMRFVTVDSYNYKSPLIYTTNAENFLQGMRGFTIKGRYYPGVKKAVEDIMWHKEHGIWNISRTNYENEGVVEIRPFE